MKKVVPVVHDAKNKAIFYATSEQVYLNYIREQLKVDELDADIKDYALKQYKRDRLFKSNKFEHNIYFNY